MPGRFIPTKIIDANIELLRHTTDLKNKSLVHFHLATSETIARVILYNRNELKPGETCYCQFRLQDPVVSMSGDRYIIRRFSPVETMGGGEVFDPSPPRRKQKDITEVLPIFEKGNLDDKISLKVLQSGLHGISTMTIEGWIKAEIPAIRESIEKMKKNGLLLIIEDVLIHKTFFDLFRERVLQILKDFHSKNLRS